MSTVFKVPPQWRRLKRKGRSRRVVMDEGNILCSWIVSLTVWLWLIIIGLAFWRRSQHYSPSSSRLLQPPPSEQEYITMQAVAQTLERLMEQQKDNSQNLEITGMISRLGLTYTSTTANSNDNDNNNVKLQKLWSADNPSDRAIRWMAAFDEHDRLSLERYAIAVLFFYTFGDDESWTRCAAPTMATTAMTRTNAMTRGGGAAGGGGGGGTTLSSCAGSLPIMTTWTSECDWYGITCSLDGQVTRIEWTSNNLATSETARNTDSIYWPNELILLQHLEMLWWSDNPRLQMKLPSFLNHLSNLQSLSLHRTQLQGTIPASMYQLTNLIALRLYETELSGTLSRAISNLNKHLGWLWLHNTHLTGSIPTELSHLSHLEGLTRTYICYSYTVCIRVQSISRERFSSFCANFMCVCVFLLLLLLSLYSPRKLVFQ